MTWKDLEGHYYSAYEFVNTKGRLSTHLKLSVHVLLKR